MALGLLVALGGCSGPKPTARAEKPRYGGVLIYAKGKDATRLDPADINEAESATVTENLFNGLVRFKQDSTEIEPALATHWEISPDGKTYTFHLREGVRFHDGTPFDARAVKISFDRQAHPQPGQVFEYWANFFAPTIRDVQVLDPKTVRLRLKTPDATFLRNLAIASMAIISPKALEKWGVDVARHPVGTGPFRFVKWVPGERLVLEANPDYWDGRPYLDKLVFKPVTDNAVRLLELEVGEVHGMDGINPDDVGRIEADPELAFYSQAGLNVGYLALNNLKPPFTDARVRRAVALAIDKPALVKAFFAGGKLGEGAVVPMPPTIPGYNTRLKDLPHDPTEARRLLAEAGYPKGFDLELWSLPVVRPYMPQGQRTAEAIQQSLAQVGIRAKIKTYEWGTYLDKVGKGDHQAALIGWVGDFGDPDNFLYTLLDAANARPGGSATNYSFYRGEAVHRLLTRARTTLDPAVRKRLYEEAQVLIQADTPMVPLFHAKQLAAFRRDVKGFALHPTGTKYFERVWLSD
ncbi:ABC transporter substrate-binding protein [bacterium]|nr:ABC transporter substrate-binding protein [bacterium]